MNIRFFEAVRHVMGIVLLTLLGACGGDFSPLTATDSLNTPPPAEASSDFEPTPEQPDLSFEPESPAAIPEPSNIENPQFSSAELPQEGLVLHLESDQGVTSSQDIVTHWCCLLYTSPSPRD